MTVLMYAGPAIEQGNNHKRRVLCHVIPTYNESENIAEVIQRTENVSVKLPFDLCVVIVDDNSQDGTADVVKGLMEKYTNLKLVQRPKPLGLGSAYLDGFRFSIENLKADFLGEMDADLQHPPELLEEMCNAATKSGSDVVIASRYVHGGGASDWSFGRRLISRGANLLTRIFLRVPIKDSTSGYRVISKKAITGLFSYEISAKGYAFQVQSLYAYKKLGMSFKEVPYLFEIRKAGKTKLDWKEVLRFASVTVKTGIFGLKKRLL